MITKTMKRKFEVHKIENHWKVWDSEDKKYITKEVPSEEIAQEIADDFEKMSNGDYSPLFE